MLERILSFSIQRRYFVLALILVVAAVGVFSAQRVPIDAVPDITNVQVQVNTAVPGYSPLEAEQRVTFPVETALAGLPGLDHTRSISRYGLSQVTAVFKDGTDLYFVRQQIAERISGVQSRLPAGAIPEMGPVSTGLGEIFMYTVVAAPSARTPEGQPYTPADLRTLQDYVIRPQLRGVEGVAEVNTIGGYEQQYHVTPDPARLAGYGLSMDDLAAAIEANSQNASAGYVAQRGRDLVVRTPGQVSTPDEIASLLVSTRDGTPIRVADVATVGEGQELRTGAATENGREVVLGTVFMRVGENARTVSTAVAARLTDVQRSLPPGVSAQVVYDRTHLVNRTIATVQKNLLEGALLVIALLFLFLGNLRAALITALVIPLSMLMTLTGMVASKTSANLMSLGALDFGLIVDGAVIIVENGLRRLAEAQHRLGRLLTKEERFAVVKDATQEVRRATLFGEAIVMVVYLPIFALTGVEGKMFTPMALTVMLALGAAFVLSLTFVPAALATFVTGKVSEKENVVVRGAQRVYKPALTWALANRPVVVLGAVVLVLLSGVKATQMGTEFLPQLDEGDIALHALRTPGTGVDESVTMQAALETRLREAFPEIERTFAKIGTAEIATDPMPPSVADNFVMLKPRAQWRDPDLPRDSLVARMERVAQTVPGSNYEFTQPIQMRFNELLSGVRADVAVKLYGDDLATLAEAAEALEEQVAAVPGAADVKTEQTTGLPMLTVELNRDALARYGLTAEAVQQTVATAVGGREVGAAYRGDRRIPIVVRLPESLRTDLASLERLPVPLPPGGAGLPAAPGGTLTPHADPSASYATLGTLAHLSLAPGPNQVGREDSKRFVTVTANVRGRDMGSFVAEVEQRIQQNVTLPEGTWVRYGGQFENLQRAVSRLQLVVPLALLLIVGLLYFTLGSWKDAALVFTGVPLALTGGIAALALRGLPFSISAGVGFIALSGVAVLNGLVMITFINQLRAQGRPLDAAIAEGAQTRLRPVLMTALVASLGFVPMALATGAGAEVQRPLATVVIGGILSSTLLTLVVLPVLYRLTHRDLPAASAPTVPDAAEHPVLA